MSLSSYANDMLWDLDTVVLQSENFPALKAKTTNGADVLLTKDYISKLDEIRKRIAQQSGVYPKFIISSSDIVNAGATWENGQPITIFTLGIISKVGDDYDAIAAIVSHEFSHLTLGHMQSQQTANAWTEIISGLAMIAIDSTYGGASYNPYKGLYQTGLDLTSNLVKSSYSRSEEIEADVQGLKYMVAAGYSPEGALRVQQNIIPADSSFFSTHPSSETRIENIKAAMMANPSYKTNPTITINSQNSLSSIGLDKSLRVCEDIGFKPKSSLFKDCVLKFSGSEIQDKAFTSKVLAVKNLQKNNYEEVCKDIGFKLKTEKFKGCVKDLSETFIAK
jgi:Zn-dependent protease with chaperone function